MTIREIAYRLNELAQSENFKFGRLQYLRQRIKAKKTVTYLPFADFGIKDKNGDNYAFHTGGRKEIQFNIGKENQNGKEIFRYGLAFSLEKGINLKDPIQVFGSKINRFNDYISTNTQNLSNYSMWYYDDQNFKKEFPIISPIPKNLQKEDYFIFIGKYFNKELNQINDKDLVIILKTFDDLLPIYEYVENTKPENIKETRVARMCWNDLGWVKPSGKKGKSRSKSHEKIYGYGHEEWNFDAEKVVSDYKYGFLEPIQRNRDLYIDMKIDILLYTVDSVSKSKYWIGKLENVTVISRKESLQTYSLYKKNGWLDSMKNDLETLNLSNNLLNEFIDESEIFNIKFKFENIHHSIFDKPVPAKPNDPRLKSDWYVLYHLKDDQKPDLDPEVVTGFDFETGSSSSSEEDEKKIKKSFETKSIEYVDNHIKIQNRFLKYLQGLYGKENVRKECKAYSQNKIDIVRKTPKGPIFYEVKSYNHLSTSLRVALGQLFEYNFYPDVQNAIKMVLVSDLSPDSNFEKYIKHLNKFISIPINYIQFDINKKEIVKEL